MNIKLFVKLTKMNQLAYILLPILMGYIYSLYQYDSIHWGVSFLLVIAMISFILGIQLMKELTIYRNANAATESETMIGRYQMDIAKIRVLIMSFMATSGVLMLLITLLTHWEFLLLAIIPFVLGIFYVTGRRPLYKTPLAELISSFGCGFSVPLLLIYANVYEEQTSWLSFLIEVFWISLPFIFSFAMIQLAHDSVAAQKDESNITLAGIMGRHTTDGVIEFATILSFIFPSISIYFNYAPGVMILMWLMFPKIWMDIKQFIRQKQQAKELPLIHVGAEMIMIFQVLLYMLGVFF